MNRNRRLPEPPSGVSRQSIEPWQDAAVGAGLDAWTSAVMRLDVLDPATTEVVRLRCASNHDCRFCRSLRLVVGGAMALDETVAEQALDHSEGLGARHIAAARLAEAMMTQPAWIDDALVTELQRQFSDDELLEISLDVMKFSHQKIKVSLGLDEPLRTGGALTTFAVDDGGRPRW